MPQTWAKYRERPDTLVSEIRAEAARSRTRVASA
jgi:hypothetical protein